MPLLSLVPPQLRSHASQKREKVPGEKTPGNKERREKGESSPEGGSRLDPDISGRRVVWVSHRRHVLQFLTSPSASAYRLCTYYRASGSGDDVHAPESTTPRSPVYRGMHPLVFSVF